MLSNCNSSTYPAGKSLAPTQHFTFSARSYSKWAVVLFYKLGCRLLLYSTAASYHKKPTVLSWELLSSCIISMNNPLCCLFIFITRQCNIDISNDMDNQQFTHWNSESGVGGCASSLITWLIYNVTSGCVFGRKSCLFTSRATDPYCHSLHISAWHKWIFNLSEFELFSKLISGA